jgi:hypothetical protein
MQKDGVAAPPGMTPSGTRTTQPAAPPITTGTSFQNANAAPAAPAGGTGGSGGQDPRDPTYVRQQVTAALTKRAQAYGKPAPTEAEIQQGIGYVLTPDTYSDGNVRSGWSDYWANRLGTPGNEGGASGDFGGAATLVQGATPSTGGGGGGLPDGYQMGTFTGGGKYPLASVMAPGLMQPWTTPFDAPTLNDTNDPGYLARMDLGEQAIQRSQAAKGTLRTGGALKDLTQFGQDYGSNEYDKVYNRALGQYTQAYNIFGNNQANQYNRLSDVAKIGSSSAGLSGQLGSQFGTSAGGLITGSGDVNAARDIATGNAYQPAIGAAVDAGQYIAQYYVNKKPPQSNPNSGVIVNAV